MQQTYIKIRMLTGIFSKTGSHSLGFQIILQGNRMRNQSYRTLFKLIHRVIGGLPTIINREGSKVCLYTNDTKSVSPAFLGSQGSVVVYLFKILCTSLWKYVSKLLFVIQIKVPTLQLRIKEKQCENSTRRNQIYF